MTNFLSNIKNILLYAGLSKSEFTSSRKDFLKLNTGNLRAFAAIMAVYMTAMYFVSFFSAVSVRNRDIYFATLLVTLAIITVSLLSSFQTETCITVLVYVFMAISFIFGIAIGATQPTQTSATVLILLMVAPLLFYDRPYRVSILIIFFTILFILVSLRVKTGEALQTDIINGVCFGTLSCILNTRNLMVRTERVYFGRKMQNMAEIDALTGLKNRNSFERNYIKYATKAHENVICLYADVNGLHEVNNTLGHEAGDEMLKFIARQFQDEFGSDDAYRLGGDEYVLIICDQDESSVTERINRVYAKILGRHYNISIGLVNAKAEGLDMDALIKRADAKMYEEKKRYYSATGKDRRAR